MASYKSLILLTILIVSTSVYGQNNSAETGMDNGDEVSAETDNSFVDNEIPDGAEKINPEKEETEDGEAEKSGGSTPSSMVIDSEIVEEKEKIKRKSGDFVGLKATDVWVERNGLGVNLGIGGLTCTGDYCDSTLDVKIAGSASGTVGVYYRFRPNISFFGDATFAYVNTNFNQLATGNVTAAEEGAFLFNFIAGAEFHLPIKGWMDIYASAGVGPVILKARAEAGGNEFTHHWTGIDFDLGLGADFYFWSVGPMKNFSIGPYMRFGFPVWPSLCTVAYVNAEETCKRPSDHQNQSDFVWDNTPFLFSTGIEIRYDFGFEFGDIKGFKEEFEVDAEAGAEAKTETGEKTEQTDNEPGQEKTIDEESADQDSSQEEETTEEPAEDDSGDDMDDLFGL